MIPKKYLLTAMAIVAIIQIAIPTQMMFTSEAVIKEGHAFKFKTAPIDPNDPFRGKYVNLNFEATRVKVDNINEWSKTGKVYVTLGINADGFAIPMYGYKNQPTDTDKYLLATINYIDEDNNELDFNYSFNRYYMDEFKAPATETRVREMQRDTAFEAYALVYIKDGKSVLQDLVINGKSAKDY